jgi:hypothetical protein
MRLPRKCEFLDPTYAILEPNMNLISDRDTRLEDFAAELANLPIR